MTPFEQYNVFVKNFQSGKIRETIEEVTLYLEKEKHHLDFEIKSKLYNIQAICYRVNGNLQAALQSFEKSLANAILQNDAKIIADRQVNLAGIYIALFNYKTAIVHILEAAKIKDSINDYEGLIPVYLQLAELNEKLHNTNDAIDYLQKANSLMQKTKNNHYLFNYHYCLGNCYYTLKKYKKAITAYEAALAKNIDIDKKSTASIYTCIVESLIETKNYKAAIAFAKKGLNYSKKNDIKLAEISSSIFLFYLYIVTKENILAEKIITTIDPKTIEDNYILHIYYKALQKYFEEKKDYKKALQYCKKTAQLEQKIYNEKIHNSTITLQSKYEIEKKENELNVLKIKEVETELKVLRSQLNPHFLFNAINTFRHEMLKGNLAEADKFLLRFSKFLRLILEGSRKDKLSLKDNVDLIENYILLEQSRQNFSFDYTIQLQKNIAVDSIFFPSNILQPIIENAIIHGLFHLQNKKGLLKINFKIAKNLLIATIEDNGIGRAASSLLQIKKHQSHALNIVQETITFLNQKYLSNAIIEVVDKMGEDKSPMGTKFIIQIPFK